MEKPAAATVPFNWLPLKWAYILADRQIYMYICICRIYVRYMCCIRYELFMSRQFAFRHYLCVIILATIAVASDQFIKPHMPWWQSAICSYTYSTYSWYVYMDILICIYSTCKPADIYLPAMPINTVELATPTLELAAPAHTPTRPPFRISISDSWRSCQCLFRHFDSYSCMFTYTYILCLLRFLCLL